MQQQCNNKRRKSLFELFQRPKLYCRLPIVLFLCYLNNCNHHSAFVLTKYISCCSHPTSQPASQPANHPARHLDAKLLATCVFAKRFACCNSSIVKRNVKSKKMGVRIDRRLFVPAKLLEVYRKSSIFYLTLLILFCNICIRLLCTMGQNLQNLLTYLIGHNNPINEFRPAATRPSRCFC